MSDNSSNVFFKELIFLDKQIQCADDFFDFIFPILNKNGYVKNSFLNAIKKREKEFPTALPISSYSVAIPHTNIEHIVKPFISVTRITKTMKWGEMSNNENEIDIKFIFLLGFVKGDDHISLLQTLMECFSKGNLLGKLEQAKTKIEFMQLLIDSMKF